MTSNRADYNLLFGVLALQADLLDAARFAEVCSAWASRKDTPLADLLLERGWLTAEDKVHVDYLLERKLQKHARDVHASLAAAATADVKSALADLHDPDIQQTLAGLPSTGSHGQLSTVAYQPGSRGRYTLARMHAKGGIGQVWLARDGDLGRDVALKELRSERSGDPAVLSRFVEEAKITGQLEHPGIVPVYELSKHSQNQQPFYTMRFVRGRTLSEASKAYHQKRLAGQAGALDLRGLLGAFVAVCNAVAYAHSRGVIHRDLKGHNVVLGDFGEVMVLDWGLAKVVGTTGPDGQGLAADESLRHRAEPASTTSATPPVMLQEFGSRDQTLPGEVLGTPGYMAPEQAEGRLDRIDHRTDVYGLGAILYEILTGQAPFASSATSVGLTRVIHEPALRPRQAVASTPPALEAVCLKALAKQPQERYSSADELAHEIERFLADEPVAACREQLSTRLSRWGRRHKTLAASAAALLLTALVALTGGTLLLGQANAETQRQRDEAQRQRDLAQENFQKARQAVDDYLIKVSESTLLQSPLPGLQPLRKQLLESALQYYQEFVRQRGDDPALQAELAAAFFRVGKIAAEIGSKPKALTSFQRARDLYEMLSQSKPENTSFQSELAKTYIEIGLLQSQTGQPTEAIHTIEHAVEMATTLSSANPSDTSFRSALATAYRRLGFVQQESGRWKAALQSCEKSLELLDQLARGNATDIQLQKGRAAAHHNLGYLRHMASKPAAALRDYQQAIDIWESLTRENPADTELRSGLASSYANLGWLHSLTGRPTRALQAYEKSLAVRQQLARDNPTVTRYQTELALIHTSLGSFYQTTQQTTKALQSHQQAVAIREKLVRDNPGTTNFDKDLAWSYSQFGSLQVTSGELADASRLYQQALSMAEKLAVRNPGDTQIQYILSASHAGTAKVQKKRGQTVEALKSFQQALAILAKLPLDHLGVAYDQACWRALCSTLVGEGRSQLTAAQQARRQQYADQAMEALRQAVASGNCSLHDLRSEPDIEALRSRADFQKLLHEVEERAESQER